jgi:outer membrane receptor protein involved in Fe transport
MLLPLLRDRRIADDFNLELGYRYSDHDPTGPVETYKGLIDWRVTEGVRIRGGRQIANRAPNIAELFLEDSQRAGASAAGDLCSPTNIFSPLGAAFSPQTRTLCEALMTPVARDAFYDPGASQPTGFGLASTIASGNPNVEHETAATVTLGAVIDIGDRTSLTIDLWEIAIDNLITSQSIDSVYADCFSPLLNPGLSPTSAPCLQILRDDENGSREAPRTTYVNSGAIETRGVDLQFNWRRDLGPGTLGLNLLLSYLDSVQTRIEVGVPWNEWKGTFGPTDLPGITGGSYDYRTFTTLNYFTGGWNVGLRWRHVPTIAAATSVTAPTTNNILPTESFDVVDVSGGVELGDSMSFRYGIDNLFGRDPPVTNATPYNPGNYSLNTGGAVGTGFYDNLGRRAYVGLSVSF